MKNKNVIILFLVTGLFTPQAQQLEHIVDDLVVDFYLSHKDSHPDLVYRPNIGIIGEIFTCCDERINYGIERKIEKLGGKLGQAVVAVAHTMPQPLLARVARAVAATAQTRAEPQPQAQQTRVAAAADHPSAALVLAAAAG